MEIDGIEVLARRCPNCIGAVILLTKTTCSDCGHELLEVEEGSPVALTSSQREVLVDILVYHYRKDIKGCACGWADLGKSWPGHIADIYEATLIAREL